jgi:hypothetical protein
MGIVKQLPSFPGKRSASGTTRTKRGGTVQLG